MVFSGVIERLNYERLEDSFTVRTSRLEYPAGFELSRQMPFRSGESVPRGRETCWHIFLYEFVRLPCPEFKAFLENSASVYSQKVLEIRVMNTGNAVEHSRHALGTNSRRDCQARLIRNPCRELNSPRLTFNMIAYSDSTCMQNCGFVYMSIQKIYYIGVLYIYSSKMNTKYPFLSFPPSEDLLTVPVLLALARAHGRLGELKGTASGLPNQDILIDTLLLQEALASSEIENVMTTQDQVFQADLSVGNVTVAAKEVARYRVAMRRGYEKWQENRFISENMLIDMYRVLKQRSDGYRMGAGTILRNEQTGEIVYEPPQNQSDIITYMRQLERVINDCDSCSNLDPLIKMALIHHKFESIHPFPDGNGRVGRMLNVLYLVHCDLLESPILYLSRAINRTKPDYYRLLQAVREEGVWEEWVEYMLNAVTETAHSTMQLINDIKDLMIQMKHRMREELPKLYSQDLLNNLFRYPYTRIEFLEKDLPYTRQTARKYLEVLSDSGFVRKVSVGRNNYYINHALVDLFVNVPLASTVD